MSDPQGHDKNKRLEALTRSELQAIYGANGGVSTCPICTTTWVVTPHADCLLPVCGCFGEDVSRANPARPCHGCGLTHALGCALVGDPVGRLPDDDLCDLCEEPESDVVWSGEIVCMAGYSSWRLCYDCYEDLEEDRWECLGCNETMIRGSE